jgi:hypothetical protein
VPGQTHQTFHAETFLAGELASHNQAYVKNLGGKHLQYRLGDCERRVGDPDKYIKTILYFLAGRACELGPGGPRVGQLLCIASINRYEAKKPHVFSRNVGSYACMHRFSQASFVGHSS